MFRAQLVGDQVLMTFPKAIVDEVSKAFVQSPNIRLGLTAVAVLGVLHDEMCIAGFNKSHGHDYYDRIVWEDDVILPPYEDHALLMADVEAALPEVEQAVKLMEMFKKIEARLPH